MNSINAKCLERAGGGGGRGAGVRRGEGGVQALGGGEVQSKALRCPAEASRRPPPTPGLPFPTLTGDSLSLGREAEGNVVTRNNTHLRAAAWAALVAGGEGDEDGRRGLGCGGEGKGEERKAKKMEHFY